MNCGLSSNMWACVLSLRRRRSPCVTPVLGATPTRGESHSDRRACSMSESATFLYVGNAETRDVSGFKLDEKNGDLTSIGTFSVPGPTASCFSFPLAVSPDKRWLFVAL